MKLFVCLLLISLNAFGAEARKAVDAEDKTEILTVLAKNDLLFNAFLKKDQTLIEKNAMELQKLVANSKVKILDNIKKEAPKLGSIKASNSNDANLLAYESFLNPLIKVVERYDVGNKYNIFSCPMVKKSWIQDVMVNKGVKNVYAMDMLECGTQDTKF